MAAHEARNASRNSAIAAKSMATPLDYDGAGERGARAPGGGRCDNRGRRSRRCGLRHLDRCGSRPAALLLAGAVSLFAGAAAAQDNAPIEVMVTSSIESSKGLSRILAGAAEGDTA